MDQTTHEVRLEQDIVDLNGNDAHQNRVPGRRNGN